jgi:hypothetical protein
MRKDHATAPHVSLQQSVANFFSGWWRDWNERRARTIEFDRADPAEMMRIAGDLGMSVPELRTLVARGAHAADLLTRRMHSLGFDPAKVGATVLRDLQRCCANCQSKTLCQHELEDRPKAARWPKYCPNETTIAGLGNVNRR